MDEIHGWEIQQISMREGQRSRVKISVELHNTSRFELFQGVKVPLKRKEDQDQGHRQI